MRTPFAVLALTLVLAGCQTVQDVLGAAPAGPVAGGGATGGRPQIVLGSVRAAPGGTARVSATLRGGGRIAGTQNDITFDPSRVAIARTGRGTPDCTANAALGKEGTAFSFQPAGCAGSRCTGVRALVLSLSNVAPIPAGSVLYTCTLAVAAGARGSVPLRVTRVGFSDPAGAALAGSGIDGTVTITE